MKMFTVMLYVVVATTISCHQKKEETDDKIDTISASQEINTDTSLVSYMIKDIDVRIVSVLVENIDHNKPWLFFDQYESYYFERDLYNKIIDLKYGDSLNVEEVTRKLNENLIIVIDFTRKLVLKNYQEYNSLEGPDFSFLYSINDSSAFFLLNDIQNNPNASEIEKKRLGETYPMKY